LKAGGQRKVRTLGVLKGRFKREETREWSLKKDLALQSIHVSNRQKKTTTRRRKIMGGMARPDGTWERIRRSTPSLIGKAVQIPK